MRLLKHQMQPCPVSCVCTSVAILAGVDAPEVVELFHEKYRAGGASVREMLNAYGLAFETFDSLDGGSMCLVGAYLVTVPSLNITGGNHQVVVEVTEDDYFILDPVAGRPGRRYYVRRGHVSGDLEHELTGFTLDAFLPASNFEGRP